MHELIDFLRSQKSNSELYYVPVNDFLTKSMYFERQ